MGIGFFKQAGKVEKCVKAFGYSVPLGKIVCTAGYQLYQCLLLDGKPELSFTSMFIYIRHAFRAVFNQAPRPFYLSWAYNFDIFVCISSKSFFSESMSVFC
jgi:hypothetical protein